MEAAKDILKATLDEWDRIVVRPYREIDQLQVRITFLFIFLLTFLFSGAVSEMSNL